MTESEWLECTDLSVMLEFMRSRVSERKLRLYLCSGCRHIAHLFFDAASIVAVEVGERFADGQADEEELGRAAYAAEAPTFGYDFEEWFWNSWQANKVEVVTRLVQMGALPEVVLNGGKW